MDELMVRPAELPFVVSLVNEYATEPRVAAGETGLPYPGLPQLAGTAPAALSLATAADMPDAVPGVVNLADRLHRIFASAQLAPQEAVEDLNLLLRESRAVPHLSQNGQATVADWHLLQVSSRHNRPTRRLQAACALALHQWLSSSGSLHRLGICHAHRCADVFLDATQAGSRRYCSTGCANRTKVAAHRARGRSREPVPVAPDLAHPTPLSPGSSPPATPRPPRR